jgi:uncharacterized protein (DUF952 family)
MTKTASILPTHRPATRASQGRVTRATIAPMIHHLVAASAWEQAKARGRYEPPTLATEGFIHCCAAAQLDAVAGFYADVDDLVVLDLDDSILAVRWEPPAHPDGRPASPDEPYFPHVYGPIELAAVVGVRPYPPQRL